MNSSFLYHVWGLYTHECTREEYKGNTIILHVQTKEREKVCPKCGKRHLVKTLTDLPLCCKSNCNSSNSSLVIIQ